jgi:ATP-binding cassette, subfamily D (ALD), peroxisomal long-chain fatty acid import protein
MKGEGSVLAKLARAWLADPKGCALLASWASVFGCVTLRALSLRRQARLEHKTPSAEKSSTEKPPAPKAGGAAASPVKALIKRAIPGWRSKPGAWGCLLSVGIGLRLLVSIKVSSEIGVLGSLLAQRKWDALFRRQLGYALWAVPAALLNAFQSYARTNLAMSMRVNLMSSLRKGLCATPSLPALFHEIAPVAAAKRDQDSAVQLCTADVNAFCVEAVALYEGLLKPSVEVLILSTTLGGLMGGKQLAKCYAYFFAAGCWTRFVGPSFASSSAAKERAEGQLLATHTRLHAFAEEVTMLRGGEAEGEQLDAALAALESASSRLAFGRFASEALDGYSLRYMGILAAFTAMLPAVYHGTTARAASDPTEYFLTCLHLLVNVGMACKDLVLSSKALAAARRFASRLEALYAALALAPPPRPPPAADGSDAVLELSGLGVAAPGAEGAPLLLQGLSLRLLKGQRLLVRGPNGAGKTSLLRVLSGVWPAAEGAVVALPAAPRVLFVPQRAYTSPQASLAELLLYPAPPSAADAAAAAADGARMLEALDWAGLAHLASTPAALRAAGGCAGLSGGEQQRLAAARLYLQRPSLAVLDEASANLEPAFEAKLFAW